MSCYLTINKNRECQKLDLSSFFKFKKTPYIRTISDSLDEIDGFTSLFDNEMMLKSFLHENAIIGNDNDEFSIKLIDNDLLNKFNYDIMYKEQKKYLDVDYLRSIVLSLYNDQIFISTLIDKYYDCYIITKLEMSLFEECPSLIYEYLDEFFINEIFSDNPNEGAVFIKYENLRYLAMFVCDYICQKEQIKSNIKTRTIND